MNVDYESYKIFYHVANLGSISKAANVLMISQPAISWHIKSLEENLGITLFVRTKRGVVLTDEGQVLFSYVKRGVESFMNGENALTNLKNMDCGSIRIGASTTVSRFVLMPYLEKFHSKYPNIDIQIVNGLTEKLLEDLRYGNLDMLVLNLPMLDSKDLNIDEILEVQDIFVGNKKYYDLTKGKVKLEDLKEYPLLFQRNPSNTRAFLDSYLKSNGISLVPKAEIVSYNLIMDFVKSGFGIGYATREFIGDEFKDSLYEIEVSPNIPKRNIGIVTLSKTVPNFSVNKFIEIIKKDNS